MNIDITLPVSGMSCAACAVSAESMLRAHTGVLDARVNYAAKSVRLSYDPEITGLESMQLSLRSIGYELIVDAADKLAAFEKLEQHRLRLLKRKLLVAVTFSLPVFVLAMTFHQPPVWMQFIMLIFSLPVVFYSGRSFYTTAWNLARHGQTSMDTLVAMGTWAAFLISLLTTAFPHWFSAPGLTAHVYYESAVIIITLILLGRFLEDRSRSRASAAIVNLMNLQPQTACLIQNGSENTIPLRAVVPGDLLRVKPGNTVPVDGLITEGSSWIEESMMSGEPLPVFRQAGDQVLAGTRNQQGSFTLSTQKTGNETVLSHIISMVEEAQSSKPPIQQLVDRVSAIFVPVVVLLALITFGFWLFTGPGPSLTYAIVSSISVLIIACPCALGLATPTALIVAIGKGASKGILFRDASGIEAAGKTDTLVIDKTGTLTTGKPRVEKIINLHNDDSLLPVFAGLSQRSDHPLSLALSAYFSEHSIAAASLTGFENIPGKGIRGTFSGLGFLVGSRNLVREAGIRISERDDSLIASLESEAFSIALFASDEELLAIAAVADPVREDAASAVKALKAMHIGVIILTGDHEAAARNVALLTGIDNFEAGLSPLDKADRIKALQAGGNKVAMAGDGINDTIALATADVGIAIGSGSDASIETAAITITGASLNQIAETFRLSRKTNTVIRQNLFWAFFYNLLALPLAAGILFPVTHQLLNPMIASAAMAFSSISVVTNSLRIRKH